MNRGVRKAVLGLVGFGSLSLGLGAAPVASAAPTIASPPASHVAALEAHRWKAQCWWIDDRRADNRRWGTARGTGKSRSRALRDARADVPNGAFVHHCDSSR
ncbi:hypothetical protein [Segniliparus rugosus]|uniref:Uncharacterized protein n=1 Tax=Segniliparus rugosus (strain ATCC BAA-974 / DSM 45345 / CCUG 50838 / CIP 108380 / JCM 13579 / CDC 945) TaxID=679197 RepID=E5XS74_SEGRC|nr:hypothetical protein [Segniliparus rugosus]EFV12859.2 hypothetical protein HMPREF9336_02346 [Segniliparus rugosus ATCC BAA-974]